MFSFTMPQQCARMGAVNVKDFENTVLEDAFESDHEIRSKIIVARTRSPPPMPLLPDAAVVMVCNR